MGLDAQDDVEAAFAGCFERLRPDVLVVGWNDVPGPFPIECRVLVRFEAFAFSPLSTARFVTGVGSRHTYHFHVKPEREGASR